MDSTDKNVVDIHCHMLPGIDDGAKTLEQSLTMARMAAEDGIASTMVTPHHLNGAYRNEARDILAHMEALQEKIDAAGIQLTLIPGSELHLVPELPDELAKGSAMTAANRGKAALVELPVHVVPMGTDRILDQIQAQQITPIIAHPERNSQLRREPGLLAEWVAAGCLGQVTAQSCTGRFGKTVKAAAEHMVTSGLIHFVASDAHRDQRRIPRISKGRAAIAEWTSPEVATLLAETWPHALALGYAIDVSLLNEALAAAVRPPRWRRWVGL